MSISWFKSELLNSETIVFKLKANVKASDLQLFKSSQTLRRMIKLKNNLNLW